MGKNLKICGLLALGLVGVLAAGGIAQAQVLKIATPRIMDCGPGPETLLFSAAGLDNHAHTDNRSPVVAAGNQASYDVTAKRISFTRAVQLTKLRGIISAAASSIDWVHMPYRINIFRDQGGSTAEELFRAAPFAGNVYSSSQVSLVGTPQYWGPGGWGEYTNYNATLQFNGNITLQPGSYLISVIFYNASSIGWSESDIDRGSSHEAAPPNYLFNLHTDFPEVYPTGTPAWNLYGRYSSSCYAASVVAVDRCDWPIC